MPAVNWDAFAQLPGSAQTNFEMLSRAIIRRHYAQFGAFAALAGQPGVEFHVKLHASCSLGEPGRWYGWQCRWYDLPGGTALGSRRRAKIVEALDTTARVLPEITDWILWTRRPLTEGDQKWFYALKTSMRLHLWTADEVEEHLSGPTEIFRGTYFGELVLSPESLAVLHSTSVAQVRGRWLPEVHQIVDAERELRKSLGETNAWADLRIAPAQLEAEAAAVDSDVKELTGSLADEAAAVATAARSVAAFLAEGYAAVGRGDLDLLRQQFAARPILNTKNLRSVLRQLRALRHPAALTVTNALADALSSRGLLDEIETYLSARLIAVLADAGGGKTELSAQLTPPVDDRPPGILLLGRELQAGRGIDDLARSVVIHGVPVASMEALVAALDAAGQRAHRRLPIVFDGLNEAEDSRDWKGPLAALDQMLLRYPYVFVVCTVRPEFADECLPREIKRLRIRSFEQDTAQAVRKYFKYYRINAADAELPFWLLRRPLALRLFCEVTNPKREDVVGIEAMPGSLTALFERYLERASERIGQLAPRTRRYYEQDVRTALDDIGRSLWQEDSRSLEMATLRQRLGDSGRPWNESIVRALEQEGVLLRARAKRSTNDHVQVLFDSLSGHVVADAILTKYGGDRFEEWIQEPATVARLTVLHTGSHTLAQDILGALVGLVPRRLHGRQLWQIAQEPIRSGALLNAAELEGKYLDAATVNELARLTSLPPTGSLDLLDRLRQTRGSPTHPLNADFLDSVLRPMTVAARDLRWTEWVRRKGDKLLVDLERLEKRWHNLAPRSPADQLCAQWVMWTLTSTVRRIRDQATRTLYWFGRGDCAALFNLALNSLTINDLYVPERVLAASYGVAMAHQLPDAAFSDRLRSFLGALRDILVGPNARHPTNHWLIREYVEGTFQLALTYHPSALPVGIFVAERIPFASGPAIESIPKDDPRATEADRTLHMDFENYTLGRLFRNRRNYDGDHLGHQAAVAHIRGTVWANGWRGSGLGSIDGNMGWSERGGRSLTERYGKKYGWIGFYTYAGILNDLQLLGRDERLSDLQIDPSFPEPPPTAPIPISLWTSAGPVSDRDWMQEGFVDVPDDLFEPADLGDSGGPWIAVHGELANDSRTLGRRAWGRLTAFLVAPKDAPQLLEALKTKVYPGNVWLPEEPSDYYTFAGEVPWSLEFGRRTAANLTLEERYFTAVELPNGPPVEVEILAHTYGWEGYHSELNQANGALVPSRTFSAKFDLRGVPQSFDQLLPDKTTAVRSFSAPDGFSGELLYLRKDLLRDYAAGRGLIWFMWGERNVHFYSYQMPHWVAEIARAYANVWRKVIDRGDFSSEPSRVPQPKAKRPKPHLT